MQTAVNRKINLAVKVMFWVMFAIFIIVVVTVVSENVADFISFEMGFFVLGGIAVILGITIVILAARSGYDKLSRSFLILTGCVGCGSAKYTTRQFIISSIYAQKNCKF